MNGIMVDLETMGTSSNAAIVAIGAVEFDIDAEVGLLGAEFYCNIDIQTCIDAGLSVDGSTIIWWLKQSEEARNAISKTPYNLVRGLNDFTRFIEAAQDRSLSRITVWGNGSNFDNVILHSAYTAAGLTKPWHFKYDRDVRTLVFLGRALGIEKTEVVREGVRHHALDDAKHQARYCQYIYSKLKADNFNKSSPREIGNESS